jgi:hypothetical protein
VEVLAALLAAVLGFLPLSPAAAQKLDRRLIPHLQRAEREIPIVIELRDNPRHSIAPFSGRG